MDKNNKPFKLFPYGKDYLWGGQRLKNEYNKDINLNILAETWEASTHPDGESRVASGVHKGLSLTKVLEENPNYLGTIVNDNKLPIIIKLIDANKDLSIQVHPSNEYAYINENGNLGKTEMWYIIDASEDSEIIYGFKNNTSREEIEDAIINNDLEKYLNRVKVKKGDHFFIDSGIIHAIGKNVLLAEIQQSSNITYRIYDYNRRDINGNLRPLHTAKALDVLNYNKSNNICNSNFENELCDCKHFKVYKMSLNDEIKKIYNDKNSFRVYQILEGRGKISFDDDELELIAGDAVFIPADSCEMVLSGNLMFLDVSC